MGHYKQWICRYCGKSVRWNSDERSSPPEGLWQRWSVSLKRKNVGEAICCGLEPCKTESFIDYLIAVDHESILGLDPTDRPALLAAFAAHHARIPPAVEVPT